MYVFLLIPGFSMVVRNAYNRLIGIYIIPFVYFTGEVGLVNSITCYRAEIVYGFIKDVTLRIRLNKSVLTS